MRPMTAFYDSCTLSSKPSPVLLHDGNATRCPAAGISARCAIDAASAVVQLRQRRCCRTACLPPMPSGCAACYCGAAGIIACCGASRRQHCMLQSCLLPSCHRRHRTLRHRMLLRQLPAAGLPSASLHAVPPPAAGTCCFLLPPCWHHRMLCRMLPIQLLSCELPSASPHAVPTYAAEPAAHS